MNLAGDIAEISQKEVLKYMRKINISYKEVLIQVKCA